LVAPTDIYPLYENASRAAFGQTLAQAQRESAEIWSRFSEVAAANEHAWLRKPVAPEEILSASPQNRPIAFPYTKLMVANASVNQGAGFIVASLAKARAMRVPEERLVFVGHGAAAREPSDVLARESYERSIALETALRKTLEFNRLDGCDLDAVELYSCFPCIPKLARRVIDWPVDRPMSVAGGLTFAGGPVGNYMSHAVAAMTERLRREGRLGLLFGNGGFANANHCILLTCEPSAAAAPPRSFDVQDEADAQRGRAPVFVEEYAGPARVETYTVFYDRDGAVRYGVVVALNPEGQRLLARVEGRDEETIARLTSATEEPVGAEGMSARREELNHWRFT
jgi:acetyl-CoA C-acetyltransferase